MLLSHCYNFPTYSTPHLPGVGPGVPRVLVSLYSPGCSWTCNVVKESRDPPSRGLGLKAFPKKPRTLSLGGSHQTQLVCSSVRTQATGRKPWDKSPATATTKEKETNAPMWGCAGDSRFLSVALLQCDPDSFGAREAGQRFLDSAVCSLQGHLTKSLVRTRSAAHGHQGAAGHRSRRGSPIP